MINRVYLVMISILFLGALSVSSFASDSSTDGQVCIECQQMQARWSIIDGARNAARRVYENATNAYEGAKAMFKRTREAIRNWYDNAWHSAVKPRRMANFRGGGIKRGNHSKGMCAQAAKEALVNSKICHGTLSGNAIDLHRRGILSAHCPRLKLTKLKNPSAAPNGSVIVYSGYAGKRPHRYGHIESKLIRNGIANYCSDFCSHKPTKSVHNQVAAIYVLE